MRCRLFIDEVGNNDLNGSAHNDNERFLSLTGIITRLDLYQNRFGPEVTSFKEEIFGKENGSSIVLHRREIIRREGPFAILRDDLIAQKFDTGLLHLFKSLPYLANTVVIDKRDHLDTYGVWHFDPYHYCLRTLIERYVLWMKRHGYQGDVSVEPRNPKPDRKAKNSFERIFETGTEHIPVSVVQKHLTTREIKFTPKSANCPAMQICDLLAYPSYKAMKHEKMGTEMPADFGGKVIEILEKWKYARNPQTHVKTGWGKKWLPK